MNGWKCPQCGKVYAPHIEECKHCNAKAVDWTPNYPSVPVWIYRPVVPNQNPWFGIYPPYEWPDTSPYYGEIKVTCFTSPA